jgi:hypothetical protein
VGDFDLFERHASENFSTSLLALSMKLSPRFGELVIRQIFGKLGIGAAKAIRIERVERECPIALGDDSRKRLDMMVEGLADGERFVVAVEAKINADFGPTQLRDYREWADGQRAHLVILTKRKYYWQDKSIRPHAELRWSDLRPLISEVQSQLQSDFEKYYWEQFRLHVEDTMRTFEGFKSSGCDVYALMQDVDLFLLRLFEEMKVTCKDEWKGSCAAYYARELAATIGFYWWRSSDFWHESQPNQFCVWKDGDEEPVPIGESFEDIVRNTQDPSKRDQYISQLADRILTLCGKDARAA